MNYLEEKTNDEAIINSIKNGEHPLLVVAQASLDALERQKLGSEYGEQDRKVVILYEYETFKATEGEQLLDTYLRYLQVINDLKKCGYKKDKCELNYKFLNNLQLEWKQYGTLMRQTKNLIDINIDALYNILKQNQGDVNEAAGYKKKVVMFTSDLLALVAEKIKVSKRKEKVVVQLESEGSDDDEDINDLKKITALLAKAFNQKKYYAKPTNNNLRTFSASTSANKKLEYKAKGKDYNYYKTKMLLAKKDDDEQLLLAKDQAWMESSSDLDQEINKNMVFMAKMEKILSDSEESSSSTEETIVEVSYYTSDSESESEYGTSEYYDNSTNYGLFVDNDDDQEIFHDAIESASENLNENHIVSQTDHDESEVDHNDSEEKDHLIDKLYKKFNQKIAKYFEKIDSSFQQTSSLKPYVLTVILEKIIIDLEDEVICLWIIDSGCSKHMTGNRALLTNFVEKFLGTVLFGNNDIAVIDGSGDVVIGSMTIKKVYYVEDGVDLLTGDRLSNLYTIALNEIASNSSVVSKKRLLLRNLGCGINPSQQLALHKNRLFIHKRVYKTPYELINKRKPNIKFFHVFGCRCYILNNYDDAGKLKAKEDIRVFVGYSKESAAFRVYNKCTRKIHESVNVNFDEISEMASNQFSLEPGLSNLNKKGKSSNPTVSQVSEISKKDLEDLFQNFYDEYFDSSKIMKSPTTNVETSNNEIPLHEGEVFHEVSESFQEESFSSSLNDDVQQSLEEIMVPPTNTQSILNESVSNTKDHPFHKIIGDPKSSVRTRGQLANSCFFTCLLSSIEPANVAEALKDANWVSAMQDELDQFARFKVWRLVPRPEGKTIIRTKWIFKNKKDESSLVIQNKARLVAVGYCQQDGIDYDETFAPVARINVIRFFLAYASRSFKWM
nr:hypothetical protein [Tanacetum cinerariifolium]